MRKLRHRIVKVIKVERDGSVRKVLWDYREGKARVLKDLLYFIYLKELHRERKVFHLLVRFPHAPLGWGRASPKPGGKRQELHSGLPAGCRSPRTRVCLSLLPHHVDRELD